MELKAYQTETEITMIETTPKTSPTVALQILGPNYPILSSSPHAVYLAITLFHHKK